MTNLGSVLKSRDITLPTKVYIVKAMVFPVVMYGWESWTIKKAEHWRIDALSCGVGQDCWKFFGLQGDQTSPLKKISPEYSLEGLMLKLKLQYFGHLMRRADSLKETLMLGKIKGRRRGRQMALLIQWTWVWASSGRWWSTRKPIILLSMKSQKVRRYWATEQQ